MYYAKVNTLKPNFKFITPLTPTTKLSEFRTQIQETVGLHFGNNYCVEQITNAEGFEFVGDYEVGDVISCGEVVNVIVRLCKSGEMANKRLCAASKRKRTGVKREESIGLELKEEDLANKVEFVRIESELGPVCSRIEMEPKQEKDVLVSKEELSKMKTAVEHFKDQESLSKNISNISKMKTAVEGTKKTGDKILNEIKTPSNLSKKKTSVESLKSEEPSLGKKKTGVEEISKTGDKILSEKKTSAESLKSEELSLSKKKKSISGETENIDNLTQKSKTQKQKSSIKDISGTAEEVPIEEELKSKKIDKKVEKFNKLVEENHQIEEELENKKYDFRPASVKKKNKKGENIFKG